MATRELKDSTSVATTTAKGVVELATSAETTAGLAVQASDTRLSDARTPTGGAGGVLSGTYPNPGFAADMATQAELDAHVSDATAAHAATAIAFAPAGTIAATTVQAAIEEVAAEAAGGGLTNPMTTAGDLIVAGSGGTPARLAKGSDGQVLTVDPTTHLLVWATPAAGGGGALVPLFATELSTAATTIDTSTLPTGYRNLRWQLTGRISGSTYANASVRVNDLGSGDNIYLGFGDYRGAGSGGLGGSTLSHLQNPFGGNIAPADQDSLLRGTIYDHEATDRHKTVELRSWRAGHNIYGDMLAVIKTTAAITSLQMCALDSGTTFDAGTRLVVWGENAS